MLPLILLALSGFLAAFSGPGQQGPGREQYTIAVDVDLAVFNMTVTDDKGRPVSGLKPGDFRVYEDGRLQNVTLFQAEDVPATIGFVIDNSGSMAGKRTDVILAALTFAHASNFENEMFIVSFNEKVSLGLPPSIPFTNDFNQIRSALLLTEPGGLTALYDALAMGIEHVKTGARERKALVVLSDGGDNASRRRLDDVLGLVQRSTVTIYTVGIYDDSDDDRNPNVLHKIAQMSGGRAYFPKSLKDLDSVWRAIAAGIRSQYTIGYHSSNPNRDGMFRKVRIAASSAGGRGLQVTTRDGYFAPSEKSIAR